MSFVRHSSVYFLITLAAAGVNYLFYPVMGRVMGPVPFGELQVLIAIVTQLGLVLTALSAIVVSLSARSDADAEALTDMQSIERLVLVGALALALVGFLLSPVLKTFFNFTSAAPFYVLMVVLFLSVLQMFQNAKLQGVHFFSHAAGVTLSAALVRLLAGLVFFMITENVVGAMLGVLAAEMVAYMYAKRALLGHALGVAESVSMPVQHYVQRVRPYFRRIAWMFVAYGALSFFFLGDILVVKHYFDAEIAGWYAAISTTAKIGYFLPAGIFNVMFASVAREPGRKHYFLAMTAGMSLLLTAPFLIGVYWYGDMLVRLLFGESFLSLVYLLPSITLVMIVVAGTQLIAMYLIALERKGVAACMSIGVGITLGGVVMAQNVTLENIVGVFLFGAMMSLLLMVLLYYRDCLYPHECSYKK